MRPRLPPTLSALIRSIVHSSALHHTLRHIGRLVLTLVRIPGLLQLACFALLLHIAHTQWRKTYPDVWEPAFPRAWITWVLVLAVVPVFASLRLGWLLGCELTARLVGRKVAHGSRITDGGQDIFAHDEERMLLQRLEDEEGHQPLSTLTPPLYTGLSSRLLNVHALAWWAQVTLYSALVVIGLEGMFYYEHKDDIRFRPVLQNALKHHERDPAGYAVGERIYIAAVFHDNEDVLPYWTNTMLDLIAYLGPNNVFVSIVENNSSDRSPQLLHNFDFALGRLHVQRRILVQDVAVPRPPDMSWNNRIDFLSALRNRALEPLVEYGGYDKVLFSNDIYVEPESLIELLETAGGHYDMACALDFAHFGAYDMWVLRDRLGHLVSSIWPYFLEHADYAAITEGDPVPVLTCWNGVVVIRADPLLPVHLRSNRTLSSAPLRRPPPLTHPLARSLGSSPALTPPLRFRSSPRGEGCFSSESFLLPYDMRRIMGLERIFVNPRVITAYVWRFYVWHKWVLRHRFVRWFVERVYDGAWMQHARMVVGDEDAVYTWDGGDCYPWWYGGWW